MLGKFNIGILGTGNIAGIMADTINKMKGVKLYAVASREKVKADVFAGKYGCKKAYGSYEELAADKKVDLIYIATPHSEHFANAKMCIENEKPVLCEKHLPQMHNRQRSYSNWQKKRAFLLRRQSGHVICQC